MKSFPLSVAAAIVAAAMATTMARQGHAASLFYGHKDLREYCLSRHTKISTVTFSSDSLDFEIPPGFYVGESTELSRAPVHGGVAARPDDFVESFRIENKRMLDAMAETLSYPWGLRLSVGEIQYDALVRQDEIDLPINLTLASTTVRGVLDALTSADGNYYWVVDGPVVDLIPKKDPHGVVRKLNRVLPAFTVNNEFVQGALSALVEQARAAGIGGLVSSRGPSNIREEFDRGYEPEQGWTFSLDLRNKTVRECLDAIVAAAHPAYWRAIPYGDGVKILLYTYYGEMPFRRRQFIMDRFDELGRAVDALCDKDLNKTATPAEREELLEKIREKQEWQDRYFPPIERGSGLWNKRE